ncbi:MAG: mannan-binding lectin [Candidatus Parabeggiatoa sp.]|nr:mannan-binding lectin [Candidatus Parabeggiatoa sp.]
MRRGAIFNKLIGGKGGWWTIKWGKMSVCECVQTGGCNIEAGPIWNQADAETKCSKTCYSQGGWNGQWWTTVEGKMSVCGCKACK